MLQWPPDVVGVAERERVGGLLRSVVVYRLVLLLLDRVVRVKMDLNVERGERAAVEREIDGRQGPRVDASPEAAALLLLQAAPLPAAVPAHLAELGPRRRRPVLVAHLPDDSMAALVHHHLAPASHTRRHLPHGAGARRVRLLPLARNHQLRARRAFVLRAAPRSALEQTHFGRAGVRFGGALRQNIFKITALEKIVANLIYMQIK